ncbi:hypothetical protein Isolate57630_50110 (plasmid) [Mycobacteroides abscessus subsp. abscessus]
MAWGMEFQGGFGVGEDEQSHGVECAGVWCVGFNTRCGVCVVGLRGKAAGVAVGREPRRVGVVSYSVGMNGY